MSFFKKRSHLIIFTIIFFLIFIFILKNFSQQKQSYYLSNEILPKFSIFLIKKNFQKIQNINSSIVEKKYLSNCKFEILNYLLDEKKNLEIFFSENLKFDNFKVDTGITVHNRIFFNFSFFSKNYSTNAKEEKLIEQYLATFNQKFEKKILKQAKDIGFLDNKNIDYDQGKNLKIYRENKINLWIIRWYSKLIIKIINPIKQKFILDNNNQKDFQLIKYNRYVIINDYIKYLVSFIYLITIFRIFSFIKKYSIIFRENYK